MEKFLKKRNFEWIKISEGKNMDPLYQLPQQFKERLQDWKELVKMYEQSNLCLSAFCQEQGINAKTFTKWERRLGVKKRETFIPVALEKSELSSFASNVYEIHHQNGFSLKCSDQIDIETVKRLLKAIGGIS
jgi:hypothetical protein